jgi:hypothetical protein
MRRSMNESEQVWRERIDWVQASGLTIAVARIQSPLSDTCIRSQLQPAWDPSVHHPSHKVNNPSPPPPFFRHLQLGPGSSPDRGTVFA